MKITKIVFGVILTMFVVMGLNPNVVEASDDTPSGAIWISSDSNDSVYSINPATDTDWYKFSLSSRSGFLLQTLTDGDTEMWLYDSSLNLLDFNDDYQDGRYFSHLMQSCDQTPLPAGTYYVKIQSYAQNSIISQYRMRLETQPCNNNTTGRPSRVRNLTLFPPDQYESRPFLIWTLPSDTPRGFQYDIRYSSTPITDSNWNSALPISGEPDADNYARGSAQEMALALFTGQRCYALRMYKGSTWSDISNNSCMSLFTDSIVPANDVDWFQFTLYSSSSVVIETSGGTGDTRLWLYSGDNLLAIDDDGGNDLFSKISRTCSDPLAPGTYRVKVDSYNNNVVVPDYTLTINSRSCGR